jgi:hypothetical protein
MDDRRRTKDDGRQVMVKAHIALARWANNRQRVDMSLHSDTLFWFRANQFLLFLLNAAFLAKKQQIPFYILCLIRPGLVPTIYRTRGEHANHYATDGGSLFLFYFY